MPARYSFHAYHVTDVLRLKELNRQFSQAPLSESSTKLVYRLGDQAFCFIFRFGSVVFFNVDVDRRNELMARIKSVSGQGPEVVISEEFFAEVKEGASHSVGFEQVMLGGLSPEILNIVALVIGQSTALEFFENRVDDLLKKTGDMGQTLRQKGRLMRRASEIKRFIGRCITTKQDLVATLYILDKPDETWNNEPLDALYRDMIDMFEIKDRYKTLDYKLKMVQENMELISELLQHRNANTLEWTIIILIAVEIILFLFTPFGK